MIFETLIDHQPFFRILFQQRINQTSLQYLYVHLIQVLQVILQDVFLQGLCYSDRIPVKRRAGQFVLEGQEALYYLALLFGGLGVDFQDRLTHGLAHLHQDLEVSVAKLGIDV